MHPAETEKPSTGPYEDEAIQCLMRSELIRGPGTETERIADGLQAIAWAVLSIKQDEAQRAMVTHAADTDHVLTLRLIDTDTFGVHCIPGCAFKTEWRAR